MPSAPNSARHTNQRSAIRSALERANRPLSPAEVHEAASVEVPRLGIATVYRNIKELVEQGWAVSVDLPGSPPRFELAGKHHHHHFVCRLCERTFEIDGCATGLPPMPRGFRVENHEIFLYGQCAECARGKGSKPKIGAG